MKLAIKIISLIVIILLLTVWILEKKGVIVREREVEIVKIDCIKKDSLFNIIEKRSLRRNSVNFKTMIEDDYQNLESILSYITSCGTPRVNNLTKWEAYYIFLTLQHSPSPKLRKEYFNIIKQLVQDSLINVDSYALMQDKILVYENLPQLYGTQFSGNRKILKVDNIDSVRARRLKLGMEPLENYIRKNNLTY